MHGTDGQYGARLTVVPYVDARAIRRRLDAVFGTFGWMTHFSYIAGAGKDHGPALVAHLQILRPDGQWVSKSEVCETTDVEALKGAASGSLKRVAASIGIGAYLYSMPEYALTVKNGGLVEDKQDWDRGFTRYWSPDKGKGGAAKKYFWRTPDGPGKPPFGIPPIFLPKPGDAKLFAGWTFSLEPNSDGSQGLATSVVGQPDGPVPTTAKPASVSSPGTRGLQPLGASVVEAEDQPKPSDGVRQDADRPESKRTAGSGTAPVVGMPAGKSGWARLTTESPAGTRQPAKAVHDPVPAASPGRYERLMPGTEFSQEFCDAWNFAVGKGERLDDVKFVAAVEAKQFRERERSTLSFLAKLLRETDPGTLAFLVPKVAGAVGEGLIEVADRNVLLRALTVRSSQVDGVKIGQMEVGNG